MTFKLIRAAVTAGLVLGLASGAAIAASPKKLTQGVATGLNTAQTALKTQDYPAALAALEKAKGSRRNGYDDMYIALITMNAHIGMKDYNAAAVDASAAADVDPAEIPDDMKANIYRQAMNLNLAIKAYPAAAKYAKLLLTTNPPAADQTAASRAMFFGGDYAGATALAQKNVDTAVAAGQKPAKDDLDIIMNSQIKQNDQAGASKTLETKVTYYGEPADWGQVIGVTFGNKGMRDIDFVYAGRLMPVTGATVTPSDATLFGVTASKQGLYGDAVAAVKLGGSVEPNPAPRAEADKKTIPAQIAAGKGKEGGEYNVKLAEVLYGYGMYAEAIEAARLSQTKGGARDATEAPMVIGMSQAAQGNYADATTTFNGITAVNPAAARVVALWKIYLKQKSTP